MIEESEFLENHADPSPQVRQFAAWQGGGVAAEKADQSARGLGGEIDEFQQGCLARTGRPGEELERTPW